MKTQYIQGTPIKGPKPGVLNYLKWAFFDNELDGVYGIGTKWNPEGKTDKWTAIKWWIRNPAHNFTWHVIGFAHKDSVRIDVNSEDQLGWNRAWSLVDGKEYPFWLYLGKRVTFYFGWRG